jgi:protein-export membrane protein SecD
MSNRRKIWLTFLGILILAVLAGLIDWPKGPDLNLYPLKIPYEKELKVHLGLDLQGGAHLVYEADLSKVEPENYDSSMAGVRDVIERRVNALGVSEPVVQTVIVGEHRRLIVELAGVHDVGEAIEAIGQTPSLDFREQVEASPENSQNDQSNQGDQETKDAAEDEVNENLDSSKIRVEGEGEEARLVTEEGEPVDIEALTKQLEQEKQFPGFKLTELSGQHLTKAQLQFDQQTGQPIISLEFNEEGKKLFAEITERNVGEPLAIFLDNYLISAPRVNEPIRDGKAVITGQFTLDEAKELAMRLNAGALPVPINLVSQHTVGAALGKVSVEKSFLAGILGLVLVCLFMIIYYRLPGVLSVLALGIYALIILAFFKLIPVTLTLAGIAGFILSIGMAVDANVLIFERIKEELRAGKTLRASIDSGFKHAWTSIRDSNLSTIITCVILAWFGVGIIKGFAITLGIGVLISMFSAITITRTFLRLFAGRRIGKRLWLFGIGKINK